jgi:predicted DNA-binding protein (MmcQ/YjbR family)
MPDSDGQKRARRGRKGTRPADIVVKQLRAFGLAYPGAHTKSPWPGHMDLAVNDKTFAYLSIEGEPLKISCKLPRSAELALELPFATPTPYGLGKAGWVTAQFDAADAPPLDLLQAWIDESYRAQAPKRLVKQLDAGPASGRTYRRGQEAPAQPVPAKVRRSGPGRGAARQSRK